MSDIGQLRRQFADLQRQFAAEITIRHQLQDDIAEMLKAISEIHSQAQESLARVTRSNEYLEAIIDQIGGEENECCPDGR